MPITWRNIPGSADRDAARQIASMALSSKLFDAGGTKIADAFTNQGEAVAKTNTGDIMNQISQMQNLDNFATERAGMSAGIDAGDVNMEDITAAFDTRRKGLESGADRALREQEFALDQENKRSLMAFRAAQSGQMTGTSPAHQASRALLEKYSAVDAQGNTKINSEAAALEANKAGLSMKAFNETLDSLNKATGVTAASEEALRLRVVEDKRETARLKSYNDKGGSMDSWGKAISADWIGDDRDRERAIAFMSAERSKQLSKAQLRSIGLQAMGTSILGDTDFNKAKYLQLKKDAELKAITEGLQKGQ